MVELELDSNARLGDRHRRLNKIVEKAIEDNQTTVEKINTDDMDLHNLFKIEVACRTKNVDYVLEVLKSEDLLYVSRALKRSVWLVTDPKYAHIINPDYLHNQLFPYMTAKAIKKFTLQIRLNLKDEKRVESFCNYYKLIDQRIAFQWLPNCSVGFIENNLMEILGDITRPTFRNSMSRLCEKSLTILTVYATAYSYEKAEILKDVMFHVNTDPEKFMDFVDKFCNEEYQIPKFNAKYTKVVMTKCSQRFTDKFEKYHNFIHIKTFAKYLNEDAKEFLLKHRNKDTMRSWFKYDNLKYFTKNIPKEGRFEFIKSILIDKGDRCNTTGTNTLETDPSSFSIYRCASFEIAFNAIKKLISNEANPSNRKALLEVLIDNAGRNPQHVLSLLQYYQERHINEPIQSKIRFINSVVTQAYTHAFDNETWNVLNSIFCSCEFYLKMESDAQLQQCIQTIIVNKILHNESVPQTLEMKFKFDTLKLIQGRLNAIEKKKVFEYLYDFLMNKIKSKNLKTEADCIEVLDGLEKMLHLLKDWKKEITDYPWIFDQIKDLIKVKKSKMWSLNLSNLYTKNKSWRKLMFQDSLLLFPCTNVCVNVLKHEPELLEYHKSELEALCMNDSISLFKLLSKMKIYWPNTLAKEWSQFYLNRLESPEGKKALVRGLCALLPQKQVIEIAKRYAPTDSKIIWNEDSNVILDLRKQLAKNIHRTRPQPSLDIIFLYAHGDYLQFSIPSLNAVLYNMTIVRSREYVDNILEAPMSLKKHGIRFAFSKLTSQELKQIFSDFWKKTKKASMRALLFKQTRNLLFRIKEPSNISDVWDLLSVFIDNMSKKEHETYLSKLSRDGVPDAVKGELHIKCYKYLNRSIPEYDIELVNPDFVLNLLIESFHKRCVSSGVLARYLLCSKDVTSQMEICEKLLFPFMLQCFESWDIRSGPSYKPYRYRENLKSLLQTLGQNCLVYIFEKKMIFPVSMFEEILRKIDKNLAVDENYVLLRYWKLVTSFVKLCDNHGNILREVFSQANESHDQNDVSYLEIWSRVIPEFAEICLQHLKEDLEKYGSSICLLFSETLLEFYTVGPAEYKLLLRLVKTMLNCKDAFEECCVMTLKLLSDFENYCNDKCDEEKQIKQIISLSSLNSVQMFYEEYEIRCMQKID